jgi:hypothetical protein
MICNRDENIPREAYAASVVQSDKTTGTQERALRIPVSWPQQEAGQWAFMYVFVCDWDHLILPKSDRTFYPIPPQRVIVLTYLSSQPNDSASPQGPRLPSADTRTLQVVHNHGSSILRDKLGFSRQQLIAYNPMAFLMAIPVSKWQLFPKHLF